MSTLSPISLDTHWCYLDAESPDADYSAVELDDSDWTALPPLSTDNVWFVLASSGCAWLRRTVVLHETDSCVRYYLQIDHAPGLVGVYVNGQYVGGYTGKACKLDVTDYVALGTNVFAFKLVYQEDRTYSSFAGVHAAFRGVRLQPVACDEA